MDRRDDDDTADQTKDDTGISRDMLMKRSPQCKNPARYYRP